MERPLTGDQNIKPALSFEHMPNLSFSRSKMYLLQIDIILCPLSQLFSKLPTETLYLILQYTIWP